MKACSMFIVAWVLAVAARLALADAGHAHGKSFAFGSPGKESEVTRTVDVQAADNMRFDPATLQVKQGETIKFVVQNIGQIKHEFALGDRASQRAHALMMKKMPNMKHEDDPAAVTVDPGQAKTVIWKFDKKPASPIEIACHEPGHYEVGMKIAVVLSR